MDWRALAAQILTEGLECFLHGYYRSAFQAAYTTVAVLCNKEYQKGQVGDNFYFLEGVHDICRDKRFSAHLSDLRGSLVGMHDRRKSIVHLEYETPGQTETLTHLETAFLFVQRVDALPPNDVVETFQSALETCRRVPAEGDRQGPTDDWPAHAISILAEGLSCFRLGYYRSAFHAAYTSVAVLCDKEYCRGQRDWQDGQWLRKSDPDYGVAALRFKFEVGVSEMCDDHRFSPRLRPLKTSLLGLDARRDNIVHRQYETPTEKDTLNSLKTATVFAEAVNVVLTDEVIAAFRGIVQASTPTHPDTQLLDPISGESLPARDYQTIELGFSVLLPSLYGHLKEGPYYSEFIYGNSIFRVEVLELSDDQVALSADELLLLKMREWDIEELVLTTSEVADVRGLGCRVVDYSCTVHRVRRQGRLLCTPVIQGRWLYFVNYYSAPATWAASSRLFEWFVGQIVFSDLGPDPSHSLVVWELLQKHYPKVRREGWFVESSVMGVSGYLGGPEIVVRQWVQLRNGQVVPNDAEIWYALRKSTEGRERIELGCRQYPNVHVYVSAGYVAEIATAVRAKQNVRVYEVSFSPPLKVRRVT